MLRIHLKGERYQSKRLGKLGSAHPNQRRQQKQNEQNYEYEEYLKSGELLHAQGNSLGKSSGLNDWPYGPGKFWSRLKRFAIVYAQLDLLLEI